MKRYIDTSLRNFCAGDNININLSKFARARLTKFLKNKTAFPWIKTYF